MTSLLGFKWSFVLTQSSGQSASGMTPDCSLHFLVLSSKGQVCSELVWINMWGALNTHSYLNNMQWAKTYFIDVNESAGFVLLFKSPVGNHFLWEFPLRNHWFQRSLHMQINFARRSSRHRFLNGELSDRFTHSNENSVPVLTTA